MGIIVTLMLIIIIVPGASYIINNREDMEAIHYCVGYCKSLDTCDYYDAYLQNDMYVCKYFVNGTLKTHEYKNIKK